ncbi:MAG: PAS domain-containing protein [Anaerolineae bacterium]|nr:MAG: PAS domain-containing protein [Anaerolineae bacterium]
MLIIAVIAFSLLVEGFLLYYAWSRRTSPGAAAFALIVLSEILYTLESLLSILVETQSAKLFWDSVRFANASVGVFTLLYFALRFTGQDFERPTLTWVTLLVFPLISVGLIFVDGHLGGGLIRQQVRLVSYDRFEALRFGLTPLGWAVVLYAVFIALLALIRLAAYLFQVRTAYRRQIYAVLLGVTFPIAGVAATAAIERGGPNWFGGFVIYALGNVLIAWGIFHFRVFDILPIAHSRLVEVLPDPVLVLDDREVVLDCNPAAAEALGLSESQVIGRPAAELISQWARYVAEYHAAAGGELLVSWPPEDARDYYLVRVTRLEGAGTKLIVAREITARVMAEDQRQEALQKQRALLEELRRKNEELERLSQEKDRLLSNVSHELRTPVMNIRLNLDLLRMVPERRQEILTVLHRETDRLAVLIDDLLSLSRLDQGAMRPRPQAFDLNVLVQELLRDRTALAKEQSIDLQTDLQEDLPLVYADRNLIAQVLSILLTNAFAYSPQGGEVRVSTMANSQYVGFRVSDQGVGIPKEEQERIFERFFRGERGQNLGIPGSGLGLAIAQEIVRLHRGRIEVESEGVPGKGTRFTVWLPLK